MKAVKAELKAGQQIILHRLMQTKSAIPFLEATNKSVVEQDRDNDVAAAVVTTSTDEAEKQVKQGCTRIKRLKEEHNVVDSYVSVQKMELPADALKLYRGHSSLREEDCQDDSSKSVDGDNLKLLGPELKACTVELRNIRFHSWWGPIVEKYLDAAHEVSCKSQLSIAEPDKDGDEVIDLTTLKARIDSGIYANVLDFHLAFNRVLSTVHVPGPVKFIRRSHLKRNYGNILKDVFPWFDVDKPTAFFESSTPEESSVPPATPDHSYSDWTLTKLQEERLKKSREDEPLWKRKPEAIKSPLVDNRCCALCGVTGDGDQVAVGRLIYFRQNEWVHANCALWSSEVYEEVDGALQDLTQAVARGLRLRCTHCGSRGATTGCCHEDCPQNYHFVCGLLDGAAYKEDKTVYCHEHKGLYDDKGDARDFSVRRTVHVDGEEARKRSTAKRVDLRRVFVQIGALSVYSLGRLTNYSSVPVGFVCSRPFWSTVDPRKMVRYTCRTRLFVPKRNLKVKEEFNLTVNHCVESERSVEKSLMLFRQKLKLVEATQNRSCDFLPPYLIGHLWKHLSYKDLHPEEYEEPESPQAAVDDEKDQPEGLPPPAKIAKVTPDCDNVNKLRDAEISFASSPTKRLNKAVSNVLKRTPSKQVGGETTDDLDDLALEADFHLEADNDLISAILRDGNFEQELDPSAKEHQAKIAHSMEEEKTRKEEVTVVRTWFNQNKRKKFSEVSQQCSLPFDVHIFDMDYEYSDLTDNVREDDQNSYSSDEFDEDQEDSTAGSDKDVEESNKEDDDQVSVDSNDILSLVAENIEKIGKKDDKQPVGALQAVGTDGGDLNELDIISKILAMSSDKLFEIGAEEQVFELEGTSGEVTLSFPAQPQQSQLKIHEEDNLPDSDQDLFSEDVSVIRVRRHPDPMVMMRQLDGVDDSEAIDSKTEEAARAPPVVSDFSSRPFDPPQRNLAQPFVPTPLGSDSDASRGQAHNEVAETAPRVLPPPLAQAPVMLEPVQAEGRPQVQQSVTSNVKSLSNPLASKENLAASRKDPIGNSEQVKTSEKVPTLPRTLTSSETKTRSSPSHLKKPFASPAQFPGKEKESSLTTREASEDKERRAPSMPVIDSVGDDNQVPPLLDLEADIPPLVVERGPLTIHSPASTTQGTKDGDHAMSCLTEDVDGQEKSSSRRKTAASEATLTNEDKEKAPEDVIPSTSGTSSSDPSPRKDFSIAGLLSPPSQMIEVAAANPSKKANEKDDDSDDDVVFIPSPEKKKNASIPNKSTRKLMPKPIVPPQLAPMAPPPPPPSAAPQFGAAANPVYVQHFSAPDSGTTFAETFQQTTGRNLQYVTSINPQQQQMFPQMATLQPPLGFIQQTPQLQLTPQGFISALPAQPLSYVTPQGFIVNPSPFINVASATPAMLFNPAAAAAGSSTPTYMPATPAPLVTTALTATPMSPYHPHQLYPGPSSTPILATPIQPAPTPNFPCLTSSAASATNPSLRAPLTPPKKVARVHPQPSTHQKMSPVRPQATKPVPQRPKAVAPPRIDPIKALSSMASQPMASSSSSSSTSSQTTNSRLTITHGTHKSSEPSRQPTTTTMQMSTDIDVTGLSSSAEPVPSTSRGSAPKVKSYVDRHRSVGTQAKIGGPLKILTPRPWVGTDATDRQTHSSSLLSASSGVSADESCSNGSVTSSLAATTTASVRQGDDLSAPSRESTPASSSSPEDHSYAISPATTPDEVAEPCGTSVVKVSCRAAKSSSIKIVLGSSSSSSSSANASATYCIQEVSVKDGSAAQGAVDPDTAIKALKEKNKVSRRSRLKPVAFVSKLDGRGQVPQTADDFVNEQVIDDKSMRPPSSPKPQSCGIWRPVEIKKEEEEEVQEPHVVYELTSEDGFRAECEDVMELWHKVYSAVQEAREEQGLTQLTQLGRTGEQMLGLTHNALIYLMSQLPGGSNQLSRRNSNDDEVIRKNPSGCARTEQLKNRKPLDMFSWLASPFRQRPHPSVSTSNRAAESLSDASAMASSELPSTNTRRATSLDLPMAMRFRHLAKNAKEAVGAYSSAIHGRGLYCKREIQAGEMVIEYAGEEIRAMLTDKREKLYESRGIGCYMFKIDDDTVVDATMKGNAARFINHSCDPNCYSKIVDILGKKHIIIFALRKIYPGEELTYDYKFPIEDIKLPCRCGAKKCRKYMN